MDDQTLFTRIIEGLLAAVAAGGWWFMKLVHSDTRKVTEDLAAYKTEVAQQYASKNDIEDIRGDLKEVKGDIKLLLQRMK